MGTVMQVSHKKVMNILKEAHNLPEKQVRLTIFGIVYLNNIVKESEYKTKLQSIMDAMLAKMGTVGNDVGVDPLNIKMKGFCKEAMLKIMNLIVGMDFMGDLTTEPQVKVYEVARELYSLCKE